MNEDFGLNWYDYGFRYYDPNIGRFTGVDPIANKFPWVTTYNYAENEPVGSIDLWGLQRYIVFNNYENQQIRSTTISTVKNSEGNLVNLGATNDGNDILEINRGVLPDNVSSFANRSSFTSDEASILNSGIDNSARLIGDNSSGFNSSDGFDFPGSFPESGEIYTAESYTGTYENVNIPIISAQRQNVATDVATDYAFNVIANPSYEVTGIVDRSGKGTNQILNDVSSRVNKIRESGGVTSIDFRTTRGSSITAGTASAISSYVNGNLLPKISSQTGVNNVGFTFNKNVGNSIRINGFRNTQVVTGYSVSRVLKP